MVCNKFLLCFVDSFCAACIFSAIEFGSFSNFFVHAVFGEFKNHVHFVRRSRQFLNFQNIAVIKIKVPFGEVIKPFLSESDKFYKTDKQRKVRRNIFAFFNIFQEILQLAVAFEKILPVARRLFCVCRAEIIHMLSEPVGKLHPVF